MVSAMCPIGCLVLWKRVPYFGDAISHASIFGVVIGLLLNINITLSISCVCILFALLISFLRREKTDSIVVVILSYTFLALGLFILAFASNIPQVDIFSYLFGDILLVANEDILIISICAIIALVWLLLRWKNLLLISINEDLARVEGINVTKVNLEFLLIVAFLIGMSIKIVGALLAASLLIIPSATARNFSSSPGHMLFFSVLIGTACVLCGITLSYIVDSASGPSIILVSASIFMVSTIYSSRNKSTYG